MASTITQPALSLLQNFHANLAKGKAIYDAIAAAIVDIEALQAIAPRGTFTCLSGDAVGDWVYISAASTVAKADADDTAKIPAIGVIVSKPSTTSCVVCFCGVATGLTGLTAATVYYLSTTAGAITATAPAAPHAVPVGISITTTSMLVLPVGLLSSILRSSANKLGASTIGIEDSGAIITATNVEAALAELATLAHAAPSMQAVNATLASGTITINAGITVAANSEVIPLQIGAITDSSNFGSLRELKASRVNGGAGVGTVVIQAVGNDGALDADAAGAIRVLILAPQ